eukprot:PhM_4_TR8696/c0_g1_i1/m.61612
MSDIAIYDDELRDLEDQVQECIDAVRTLKGSARAERYNKAQEKLKDIGRVLHQFNIDLRTITDASDKALYQKKSRVHTDTIASLRSRLVELKNAGLQEEDGGAGGAGGGGRGNGEASNKGEARKMAKNITDIQNSALESLKRSEAITTDTERIGAEAATDLRQQTEQIKQINEKLDELESHVQRAQRELNAFIRRMATDKLILAFALLIVICIIAGIAMKLTKGKDDSTAATPVPTAAPTAHLTPPPTVVPPKRFN